MIYSKSEIVDQFTPLSIYHKVEEFFSSEKIFLLESAVNNDDGNFSYTMVGALEEIWHKNGKSYYKDGDNEPIEVDANPLAFLKKRYKELDKKSYLSISQELKVDFVDGFVGYIGYDMVKEFEPVLKAKMNSLKDETDIPDFYMMRPKVVVAFSHKTSRLTLISSNEEISKKFDSIFTSIKSSHDFIEIKKATKKEDGKFSFSKEQFCDMVECSKEMIRSGDVFQHLISNRYRQKVNIDPFSFYRVLKSKNPSPYMYLLDLKDFQIVGSSPEVMVRLEGSNILLRPIAGTRKRGATHAKDKEMEQEMLGDEKERAEHIMLVDLGRNDIGRVAKKGSVRVSDLMRVERYSHVMHMVSDVEGELDSQYDMFDLFAATFTAGTMTGTPKIRAMELIAEFEGVKRSFYSGSIGYFGFNGNVNSAITIRTAMIKDEEIILQAGAGVVADSKPELEYKEVRNKLGALMSTVEELS
ncbi:MAG: anthranilate synthase component I family protein [Campylobacterales bacterium]